MSERKSFPMRVSLLIQMVLGSVPFLCAGLLLKGSDNRASPGRYYIDEDSCRLCARTMYFNSLLEAHAS